MKPTFRLGLALGLLAVAAFVVYQQLSPSQRRYLREFFEQMPYLIPRYFV